MINNMTNIVSAVSGFLRARLGQRANDFFSRERLISAANMFLTSFARHFPYDFKIQDSEPVYSHEEDQYGWPTMNGRLYRIDGRGTSFLKHEITGQIRTQILTELNSSKNLVHVRDLIQNGIPQEQRYSGQAWPDGNPDVEIEFVFVRAQAKENDAEPRYQLGLKIYNTDPNKNFQNANHGTILGTINVELQTPESHAKRYHHAQAQHALLEGKALPKADIPRLEFL